MLVKEKLINESQLREAVNLQKTTGKRLGEALVNLRYVTENQLAEILGRQLGLPFRSFEKGELTPVNDPQLKQILPDELVRKQLLLPLAKTQNTLTIALADPLDLILIDNVRKISGLQVSPVIATKSDLVRAIEEVYGKRDLLKEAIAGSYEGKAIRDDGQDQTAQVKAEEEEQQLLSEEDLQAKAGETQVVRLVDLFLLEAVNSRASDIHIEPYLRKMSVRLRIDGVLNPVDPPAPHLLPAIISRIKILAKMDIAEKRLPQDGGFTIRVGEKNVDLRVSTIPTVYGEKIVLRLLDKSNLIFNFKDLGMSQKEVDKTERALMSSYGLIFLTGPTGSGKSTTLYGALNRIKSSTKNILTIEDPVEYKLEGLNQVQAKPQIGLTFAAGLRAFLRQDPDIIMVGEVRDLETAEICVRAALTGHLVLSTLHTNDAPSAITRLIDLGIAPFLLSPSLLLVIAQRLVRKLCESCKEPYELPQPIREKVKLPEGTYYRAKGCAECRNTGFRGRIGVFEILEVDEKMRELISKGANATELRKAAKENGMKSLFQSGIEKTAAGITTLEEVFSVTFGET
ncbi:MAG: Flp pilus assembly complex ATPase component TadA [Candidatus Omnitrophica bacterium]|nr:Flp pilus assembly complex ATPase component TadA [Candidatus Omnitrophota bacterium]